MEPILAEQGHSAITLVFPSFFVYKLERWNGTRLSIEVADLKARYVAGQVGDVEVKRRLIAALNSVLAPIRQRRHDLLAENPSVVEDVLRSGAMQARGEAADTIRTVRVAMQLDAFE